MKKRLVFNGNNKATGRAGVVAREGRWWEEETTGTSKGEHSYRPSQVCGGDLVGEEDGGREWLVF